MSVFLRCPQGHLWHLADSCSSSSTGPAATCPVCGAAVDRPPPKPGQGGGAEAETLLASPPITTSAEPETVSLGEWVPAEVTVGQPAVPGYEILGTLGRGGMGLVYKARQIRPSRVVALKMILAGAHAGEQEVARFRAEAEAIARLQHANIVQVYEVGEHAGLPYFSLEFCAGGSLAWRLRGTPLPPPQAAQLVETLARAMHAAHQAGIVHRDLKPANVLLSGDPDAPLERCVPKITDFGLAKRLDVEAGQTASGAVLGTPCYMAPEQATGKHKSVGPAADVYALGAVLYELLTGRPPFQGASLRDTLDQVCTHEPLPPSRLQPKVPRDLETICLKCLEKEPGRRYARAAALAEDVRRFLAHEPIVARPASLAERLAKWVRRQPAAAALVLVSAVATLTAVGLVVGLVYNRQLLQARQAEEQQRQRVEAALERSETYLYLNRIGMADRNWWANNVGRTRALLGECPLQRRGWEWHYLDRLCRSDLLHLAGHDDEVPAVAFSPDGTLLASCCLDGTIKLWDTQKGSQRLSWHANTLPLTSIAFSRDGKLLAGVAGLAGQPGGVKVWNVAALPSSGEPEGRELADSQGVGGDNSRVAFSPDGRRLAVASGGRAQTRGEVCLFDVVTGRRLRTFGTAQEAMFAVAFAPDGLRLATGSGAGNLATTREVGLVQVWDGNTGEELHRFAGHAGSVRDVAFSPDGRWLASAGGDRRAKLWEIASGRELHTLQGHGAEVRAVAFRPDGRQLATASEDGSLKVWDVGRGEELFTLRGHTADVDSVAWHPDGRRLASAGMDHVIRIWDATDAQEARTLRHNAGTVYSVAFSPDGRWLASGSHDHTVQISTLPNGGTTRLLGKHDEAVWCVAFSPDSRLVAAGAGDWQKVAQQGEVRVWDMATGRERFRVRAHPGLVWSVAFSPDGTKLASAGGELTSPGEVKLWDTATGAELMTLPQSKGVSEVAFRPDGRQLAAVADHSGTLKVWDAATGAELVSQSSPAGRLHCVAYSADGRLLATGCSDQTAQLWDAGTGEQLATLRGHRSDVVHVAFSPDSRRLATACYDQTIKLWDLDALEEVLTLKGHTASVNGVAFSLDGRWIASGSDDQTVRIWDATPAEERKSGRGR